MKNLPVMRMTPIWFSDGIHSWSGNNFATIKKELFKFSTEWRGECLVIGTSLLSIINAS